MAYSELIKDFSRIRSYMRRFFVYGFESRREYDQKSVRSYDNERRRVESWLGDYMAFRRTKDGKNLFIAVDSRSVAHNPLYQAFKAKTFTGRDITLHFLLLDALCGGAKLTAVELTQALNSLELDTPFLIEEATIRRKLREYTDLGLLRTEKRGRELLYFRDDAPVALSLWRDALLLFSEIDPLGVVGSTLLDKLPPGEDTFSFKHHYILRALESEILHDLLCAIDEKRVVSITRLSRKQSDPLCLRVVPLRIRAGTQDGRYYLLGQTVGAASPSLTRVDRILSVAMEEPAGDFDALLHAADAFCKNLWGASCYKRTVERVEMVIHCAPFERYVVDRLCREKRVGQVEQVGDTLWRFTADVYDAMEMMPWLRTFMGRIVSLKSSNPALEQTFAQDTREMLALYGGEDDALS